MIEWIIAGIVLFVIFIIIRIKQQDSDDSGEESLASRMMLGAKNLIDCCIHKT